jgi:hypothetical protein
VAAVKRFKLQRHPGVLMDKEISMVNKEFFYTRERPLIWGWKNWLLRKVG